jgi:hypothetical protein
LENWVNPFLAGIAVWLIYRLGRKYFDVEVGVLSAVLMSTSPLFLIQASTFLSHIWSLVLTCGFVLFWLDAMKEEQKFGEWVKAPLAGLCLGLVGLTRPLTMAAVSVPFIIQGIILVLRGSKLQRRRIFLIGGIAALLVSLHLVWQMSITGDFFTNPYTLWWLYDKYGFGIDYGVKPGGHTLLQGFYNTKHSLRAGLSDLFGWGTLSWIFLPAGIIRARKSSLGFILVGLFISLVALYSAYWVGSWLLGPRYYFEGLPGLVLISTLGIHWLAGDSKTENEKIPNMGFGRYRKPLVFGLVLILIFVNAYFYLPQRLGSLQGLYGIERIKMKPFETVEAQEHTPALVIVHSESWMPYGNLLELESPWLDTPFIFAWSLDPYTDHQVTEMYRNQRTIIHYYPEKEPWKLYIITPRDSLIE